MYYVYIFTHAYVQHIFGFLHKEILYNVLLNHSCVFDKCDVIVCIYFIKVNF